MEKLTYQYCESRAPPDSYLGVVSEHRGDGAFIPPQTASFDQPRQLQAAGD